MTISSEYDTIPKRIQSIYDTCSLEEKRYLVQILQELSDTGTSTTYDNLWLQDYKELPVDLDTFLCDDRYLGLTNREGQAIYPYWKQSMHDIFDAGNQYTQCIFTGATRIGKTSTAITCAAYMLYRMLCLRDPQKFFQKKEISQFSLLFFNLTLDLAKSVAFKEFNSTLAMSPWFLNHGQMSRSLKDPVYIPEGGKIVIEAGSDVSHSLGKQIFCLAGGTFVLTDKGWKTLKDLKKDHAGISVFSWNFESKSMELVSDYKVKLTKIARHTIKLFLDKGQCIEGTPEHRILMRSGVYMELKYIRPGMYVETCGQNFREVQSILTVRYQFGIPVYDIINCGHLHNFIIRCGDQSIVAHNCCVLDEVNFARSGVKDVQKAKARIKEIYDSAVARVEGTFRQQGEVYGKIFAVSSKKTDSDFLEDHVSQQLAAGNKHLISFDKPQWEVLPPDQFSSERFHIAIGDRHRKGFVIADESPEALDELRDQGYQILEVPIDMKTNFIADFDISLRDLAGISVPGALSFITQDIIDQCIGNRRNPFYQEILEIGTKDTYTIEEFFHIEFIDKPLFYAPMFIDVDLSLNDDKTGISGVALTGRKDIKGDDGKVTSLPSFTHVFSIDIKSPRGDKIPYAKITSFILWLRRQHFNIERISRDQYQSEYMGQLLEEQGFKVDKLSVDRTPDGYMAFRDVIITQRIDLLDIQYLQNELIRLQRDGLSNKIDHPIGESKDMSDSLARATWNAIRNNSGIQVPRKTVAKAIATTNRPKYIGNADNLQNLFPNLYPNRRR